MDSHELYDLGHLYEAAVAHYQATGKRTLLDVALRTADLLDRTFGPGKRSIWPGHQITEMGLVKLYRVTGDGRYLALAKFLLDERGPDGTEGAGRTVQPVAPEGGRAETRRSATPCARPTCTRAWPTWPRSPGSRPTWTPWTGSGGTWSAASSTSPAASARRAPGEAFGIDYELPNLSAYNETCAAIGNDFWNHRLFLLHADARYIDVMERTLYNGLLSGVSLDGRSFFYPNPLESAGQHQRSPWFGVACCPGNMTRFLASVPGYVYAQAGRHALREPLRGEHGRGRDGRRPQGQARPGDALSLGRRGPDHGDARTGRAASRSSCASPGGRAARRCRATSTASPTRPTRR